MVNSWPSACTSQITGVPGGEYFTALSSKLSTALVNAMRSPMMGGNSGGIDSVTVGRSNPEASSRNQSAVSNRSKWYCLRPSSMREKSSRFSTSRDSRPLSLEMSA